MPQLLKLFARTSSGLTQEVTQYLLRQHNYHTRSKITELNFGSWNKKLNPKFIKEGFVYVLRGDTPNQEKDGFYSRPYTYAKLSTEKLYKSLKSSDDVGYFLFNDKRYLNVKAQGPTIAQELALKQTEVGGSSFISTTTNINFVQAGTGNQPTAEEKEQTEIYVLKIPVEYGISSDTGNHYGLDEDEVLIADFIHPKEIIAKFNRSDNDGMFNLLQKEIGIERHDLRL